MLRDKGAELIEIGVKGYAVGGLLNKDAYLDIMDKIISLIIAEMPTIEPKEMHDWY